MKSILARDKEFYGTLAKLALPMALQNLIASSLNIVDTMFMTRLGETAVAAVGLANQVFFLYNLFSFGICSGAAIFTAQFWGKRDQKNVRRVLGFSLIANLLVALLFFVIGFCLPGQALSLFSKDPAVIRLGGQFLRIFAFSFFLLSITTPFAFSLRGVGKTVYPMVISFLALGLNTLLNYLLIFGRAGLPRMGVRGSATATLIARVVELGLMLGFVYGLRLVPAARLRELLDLSMAFVKKVLRTIVPVVANESLWAIGFSMYAVIYGHMGTRVIAAYNVYATVDRLSFVLFFGLANACAVMVGHRIGAGEEDTAFLYAKRFALLGPALGILTGLTMLGAAGSILGIYSHVGPAALSIARRFLTVFACTTPIRIFNLTLIVGILRSGGDTKFSLFLDTTALWCIAVPLAFLTGLVWHGAPVYVYLCATLEELIKFSIGLWRLLSRRWINNLVRHMPAPEAEVPAMPL